MTTLPPEELQYQEEHKSDNRGPKIIVSLAIMLAIAYIAVGLRFWSRRMNHVRSSYDHWMMVLGLVRQALHPDFFLNCALSIGLPLTHRSFSQRVIS